MMIRNRALVLALLPLAACAHGGSASAGSPSSLAAVEAAAGCWTMMVPGSMDRLVPPLAVVRLDTDPVSEARPEEGMRMRMYVRGEARERPDWNSSWMPQDGGDLLQLRLGGSFAGVDARVRVVGDRMRGQVRTSHDNRGSAQWVSMMGSRVDCPAELAT